MFFVFAARNSFYLLNYRIVFAAVCARKQLELRRNDFQPAKVEVHTPRIPTRKSIRGDGK